MDITLTQMEYLLAVAELGSFGKAAERCHVSQPALSMQVQKAEDLLGVLVLDRSRKPVVPTDVGEKVIAQIRAVLREAGRIDDVLSESRGEVAGPYRLGIIPTLAPYVLPRFLPRFARAYPKVELEIQELQTERILHALAADRLDGGLAVTPLDVPGLTERALFYEPFEVFISPKHKLSAKKSIAEADLHNDEVWIMPEGHCFRSQVLQLCRASGSGKGPIRFESGSIETLMKLVEQNFGITVVPHLAVADLPAAKRRRYVRPFAGGAPVREVSLLLGRAYLRRAIANALCETIRASMPAELLSEAAAAKVVAPIV